MRLKTLITLFVMGFTLGLVPLLLNCSSGPLYIFKDDVKYEKGQFAQSEIPLDWKNAVVRIQMDRGEGSGVCVGHTSTGESIVLSARHIAEWHTRFFRIWSDGVPYSVFKIHKHPEKDLAIFIVTGHLKSTPIVDSTTDDFDITIGWVKKQLRIYSGMAIPGMSGGGVFSSKNGLYAIISTVSNGVNIRNAVDIKEDGSFIWR